MTDRLSALLHEEAERLDVPMPAARETLAAGRRVRRRRRLTQVAAVGGALAVIGAVGIGTAVLDRSDPRPPADGRVADTSPTGEPVDLGPVFAMGKTLYLDEGATRVEMDEVIQAMYFTSAGLLLRTNETGASDGGAPFHFALVTDSGSGGSVDQLDLTLGEVVPSTDPRQPLLAYAQTDGGLVQVVIRDVASDQEVARVDVPGLDWSGGWEAPPVSLAGDFVYLAGGEVTTVVDWRTGAVSTTDLVQPGWPQAGGRSLVNDDGTLEVVDVATGEVLVALSGLELPWGSISPDGRWAMLYDQVTEVRFQLYDLESGAHVPVEGPPWEYGWTAGGDLYGVRRIRAPGLRLGHRPMHQHAPAG